MHVKLTVRFTVITKHNKAMSLAFKECQKVLITEITNIAIGRPKDREKN